MAGVKELSEISGFKPVDIYRLFDSITKVLDKEGKLSIKDFGTFKKVMKKGGQIINPNDGRTMEVQDYFMATFSSHKALRKYINKDRKNS